MHGVKDAHLAVVTNRSTGLFHGALYSNRPTPSGCARYLLAATLDQGHPTSRAAAEAANRAFPDLPPLDPEACGTDDFPEGGFGFPRGTVLTRIRTRRPGDPREGAPDVEVTLDGRVLDIPVTAGQLERLVALGHVDLESSSGRNPELYYVYDHYELTDAGMRFHGVASA